MPTYNTANNIMFPNLISPPPQGASNHIIKNKIINNNSISQFTNRAVFEKTIDGKRLLKNNKNNTSNTSNSLLPNKYYNRVDIISNVISESLLKK